MKTRSKAKQIAQTSILVVLVVGVAAVFLASPRGQRLLGGGPGGSGGRSMWNSNGSQDDPLYDEEEDFDDYEDCEELLSLPACQDLRNSLARLDHARTRLLEVAAEDDQEELDLAGSEYRICVKDVNDSFSRLRSFVEPDVYESLVEELVSNRDSSGDWTMDQFLPEWELGILKREINE